MVASLLVRLSMVALTMAVVCWIGWTVPASQKPEIPQAAGPIQVDRPALESTPLTQSPDTFSVSPERRQEETSRHTTTITLDLNQASEQDLERLPGIGAVLAGRIVEYREARGAFQDIGQLRRVKGIGKKTFERIRPLVAVVPSGLSKPTRKAA